MRRALLLGLVLGGAIGGAPAPAPAQDKDVLLIEAYAMLAARVNRSGAALRKGDLDACEREARACLDKLDSHHDAHSLLGQVLYKRGAFDQALEQALAAQKGFRLWAEAVKTVEQRRLEAQAEKRAGLLDDVMGSAAADAAAEARASCQVAQYDKAARDAKDKLNDEGGFDPKKPGGSAPALPASYHYFEGNCLFRLKRLAEAEAAYRRALEADPDFGETYNNLINLLFMEKRLDEARALLVQAESRKAAVSPGLKQAVLDATGR